MKLLVTGASGNVGQFVVRELMKKEEAVVACGTDQARLTDRFGSQVETVRLDFTDPDTFDHALAGIDRVFLMRPPHLGKPEDLYPFIDAMQRHDIQLVCFLSLMGIEKNTIPPHHKIEKYIERAGLPFAHVRPGFFMQNITGIHAHEIRENNEIFVPAGKSRTSFIDAADIGLAVATILQEPAIYKNTVHTLTGSQSLDYYEIAEILSEVTGRRITYRKPGFLAYRRRYIKGRGLDKTYVNVTIALYLMTRLGTAAAVTDGFARLTGQAPQTFREFARKNSTCFTKTTG